ncbi:MAG: hypothetical protein V4649_13400 [Bacteroidota bacterium]
MSFATLKDDLLQEFREERIMINEQIALLDPLATSLRRPAAQRLLSSGTLMITETSCYIVSLGGVAFVSLMHRIYPLSLLNTLLYDPVVRSKAGSLNIMYLLLAVYGIASISVIGIFIIGRMAREMRLKNDILNHAGKDIKTIVGQHLERKAALDTIEQRHHLGVSSVSPVVKKPAVNDMPNPGYNGYSPAFASPTPTVG